MSFTNRKEVHQALEELANPGNLKQIEKITWWVGYLEGYIGPKQLDKLESDSPYKTK